jgi:ribosome-binding protein aMBF1 (putative translation factor)
VTVTVLTLGEAVRLARRHAGLPQWQLAKSVGVRQSAVSSWETGRWRPSATHLDGLTRVLGPESGRLIRDAARKEGTGSTPHGQQ